MRRDYEEARAVPATVASERCDGYALAVPVTFAGEIERDLPAGAEVPPSRGE